MSYQAETPFDSVEGAQEYLKLLSDALLEVRRDVDRDIAVSTDSNAARRLEALRLVQYKLERLEYHLKASCRELNGLRALRRLLLQERAQTTGSTSK